MKPLAGLKVLDFTTLLPGPYATMLMADLGADVVRVESPTRDDLVRNMVPRIDGQSAAFRYLNRGKRSIAMDLKHERSRELILQLVQDYDIVVEQFRPGVMQRLGLGFEALSEVKPDLIYCAITGYGQTGEYAQKAGHDINFLALSGVASHLGRVEQGPCPLGVQVADQAAGSHPAVIGILSAVIRRDRTGKGGCLDISMADNSVALQALLAPGALNGAEQDSYETHFLNGGGFYDYYQTRDHRYVSVGSLEPQFKRNLLQTLEADHLATLDDAELKTELKRIFSTQDLATWQQRFQAVDACVEPVLSMTEAAQHPAFTSRDLVQTLPGGEVQIASAIRFEGEDRTIPTTAPLRGADTDAVLAAAGLTNDDIQHLRSEGVFG